PPTAIYTLSYTTLFRSGGEGSIPDLVKREPGERHVELLALPRVPFRLRDDVQVPGEEDRDPLRGASRGRGDLEQVVPGVGPQVRLLGQLPLCREDQRLAVDVGQTCWDLPLDGADRVAVLVDEGDPACVVQSDDSDRTRVIDVVAGDSSGSAEVDDFGHHVPHPAVEPHLTGDDRTRFDTVDELQVTGVGTVS